jgi:hypothetical protein
MRFRAYIAISASAAALALVGLAAPVASQPRIAPSAQLRQYASNSHANKPRISHINNIPLLCSVPGESYTVTTNNINIRTEPAGGSVVASIPRGAWFDSNWLVDCAGLTTHYLLGTEYQYSGQQWVKGWRHSDSSQKGYVGSAWLAFRKFCTATGC